MLRATLLSLIATVLVPSFAAQVPLASGGDFQAGEFSPIRVDEDTTEWGLDKLPNTNTTDHLVFDTVHSLLQHWPNTRMRNGHTIVPGKIPIGTLLYHGTTRKELPSVPDWVATDPEHSYIFCRARPGDSGGCWQLTFATTRPLKVVYFDGSSAAKLPYGPLDTQELIAWGRSGDGSIFDEQERIEGLCEWAKNVGVDGLVRMEMDFEIMLCDFTSGVRVVSFVNLVNQYHIKPTIAPFTSFQAIDSGAWHNNFPGETRIQLDLTGLVSFYDTELVPSLVDFRVGQERWDHRAGNISSEELSAVKSRLEEALIRPDRPSSGVDWKTLFQVIVDRYADRLELTRYLLNSSVADSDEITGLANQTQAQLRIMLTPYILVTTTPTDQPDIDWAIPIYKLCATAHTHSMEFELAMTDSEKLLLRAVRGTSREICRVVTKMWAAGVEAGIDPLLNTRESFDIAEVRQLWTNWVEDLDRLMAWLDWSVWVKCNPECNFEEMCYLPTWPVGFPKTGMPPRPRTPSSSYPHELYHEEQNNFAFRTMVMESLAEEMWSTINPEPDEWVRPQPKCVRRLAPYEY